MKVCIVSGRYPATGFDSAINHKMYAEQYGYTYAHCNWPTKADSPYLNKIHYIQEYFDLFDYIIWIDDDAFFYDFGKDIMQYAPTEDNFISFCKSPSYKELKTYLSSGQFIIKCDSVGKKFLNLVLNQSLKEVKKWWKEELGYFSNGDQDIIIYLLLIDNSFKGKFKLYDYKCFNSRAENVFDIEVHKPLILHFTGKPKVKIASYLKIQKKCTLSPALVPKELQKHYMIINSIKNHSNFKKLLLRLKRGINKFLKEC